MTHASLSPLALIYDDALIDDPPRTHTHPQTPSCFMSGLAVAFFFIKQQHWWKATCSPCFSSPCARSSHHMAMRHPSGQSIPPSLPKATTRSQPYCQRLPIPRFPLYLLNCAPLATCSVHIRLAQTLRQAALAPGSLYICFWPCRDSRGLIGRTKQTVPVWWPRQAAAGGGRRLFYACAPKRLRAGRPRAKRGATLATRD